MTKSTYSYDIEPPDFFQSPEYKSFCARITLIVSQSPRPITQRRLKEKLLERYEQKLIDKFLAEALKELEQTCHIKNVGKSVLLSQYVRGDGNFEVIKKVSKKEVDGMFSAKTFSKGKKIIAPDFVFEKAGK